MIDPGTMSEGSAHAHPERTLPHQDDRRRDALARRLARRVLRRLGAAASSRKA